MRRIRAVRILFQAIFLIVTIHSGTAAQTNKERPYIPVGLIFARIEEGARIFTPLRLLPFDHPESMGHQFPNALQLYGTEYSSLIWLGLEAGYKLQTTLSRYPTDPSPDWPYKEFTPPPDTAMLRAMPLVRLRLADAPLKGLRAVVFVDLTPACFVLDTRNLTLAERGMQRATSMGLDLTRAEFLARLDKASVALGDKTSGVVIYSP
jgi:hypothetical protein